MANFLGGFVLPLLLLTGMFCNRSSNFYLFICLFVLLLYYYCYYEYYFVFSFIMITIICFLAA